MADDRRGGRGAPAWPSVDVVLPVLNEEAHLADAVRHVLDSDYEGELDIVLAVGPSTDLTREVADDLARTHSQVRVVDNPSGKTPAALNRALEVGSHDIVVRVDAHGFIPHDYVRRAVAGLLRTGAANIGGVMAAVGVTPFEQAVATAMRSRLGIGGAPFHVGGQAGPADSVYLGVFRRAALEKVGGFDEHFTRAQDWELNYRLRQAGEVVWFDPDLAVTYRPRSNLRDLARQFHGSGRWRREVMSQYPHTVSVRYLAPPVALVATTVGVVVGVVGLATGARALTAGIALPAGYLLAVAVGSAGAARPLSGRARAWLPVVVVTMHMSWAAGFLLGTRPRRRRD